MLRKMMEKHDKVLKASYANMAQRVVADVLKHIDTTPKEDLHRLLPEEWEDA